MACEVLHAAPAIAPTGLEVRRAVVVCERELGSGTFAKVWLGAVYGEQTKSALKIPKGATNILTTDTIHEISVCRYLTPGNGTTAHANRILLNAEGNVYLSMDTVVSGTLYDTLSRTSKQLPWHCVMQCMDGLLRAIDYLHSKLIVHHDISTGNVAVIVHDCKLWQAFDSVTTEYKLMDFGSATTAFNQLNQSEYEMTTRVFQAPECISTEHGRQRPFMEFFEAAATDVWSAGAVMFNMLSHSAINFPHSCKFQDALVHIQQPARDVANYDHTETRCPRTASPHLDMLQGLYRHFDGNNTIPTFIEQNRSLTWWYSFETRAAVRPADEQEALESDDFVHELSYASGDGAGVRAVIRALSSALTVAPIIRPSARFILSELHWAIDAYLPHWRPTIAPWSPHPVCKPTVDALASLFLTARMPPCSRPPQALLWYDPTFNFHETVGMLAERNQVQSACHSDTETLQLRTGTLMFDWFTMVQPTCPPWVHENPAVVTTPDSLESMSLDLRVIEMARVLFYSAKTSDVFRAMDPSLKLCWSAECASSQDAFLQHALVCIICVYNAFMNDQIETDNIAQILDAFQRTNGFPELGNAHCFYARPSYKRLVSALILEMRGNIDVVVPSRLAELLAFGGHTHQMIHSNGKGPLPYFTLTASLIGWFMARTFCNCATIDWLRWSVALVASKRAELALVESGQTEHALDMKQIQMYSRQNLDRCVARADQRNMIETLILNIKDVVTDPPHHNSAYVRRAMGAVGWKTVNHMTTELLSHVQ